MRKLRDTFFQTMIDYERKPKKKFEKVKHEYRQGDQKLPKV